MRIFHFDHDLTKMKSASTTFVEHVVVELSDADNHTKQHAMTARLLLRSWIVILTIGNVE